MLMGSPAMGLMMALCMVFVFCTDAYLYEVLTVLTSVIGFSFRVFHGGWGSLRY